jgi:4-hydroxyphenylpyruvate dioxygenase
MTMRKGIATVSVSGTLDEKLAAIAAAKFDGIELFDNDLIASPLRPADVARRCADLGLSIDLFQPVRDVEGVDPDRFPEVLRRVGRKLDVMAALGTTTVLACSNALPDALDDRDLSAEQLSAVGDLAQDRGFTIAFEALAWGTHIGRVSQAWDVVQRADHPAVGLCVDTFHLLARRDDATAICGVPGDRIAFLQVADAPHLSMDVLEWSRHFRCFPGQGTLDVASVVAAVVEAGYRGPISLEVFSDVVRAADPRITSLDAMRSLLFLEEQLRRRWHEPDQVSGAGSPAEGSRAGRARVELFDPPPAPTLVRPAFVELSVAGDEMAPLLRGMGFAVAGKHRSKPVTWWRNGAAHVLTNAGSALGRFQAGGTGPVVTTVGIETEDVPAIEARGAALLWPQLYRRLGRGEAALVGIDSPSGVQVLVSEPSGSDVHWQADFDPVEGGAAGDWLGVDHIGCVLSPELLDAEISFYRTLFGMGGGPTSEFMDPQGRLRSRVVRPSGGGLRIVLNVNERRSGEDRDTGVNQLAFACPDIFAAAGAMRAGGLDLMKVHDNYYDDLQARFDLREDIVSQLRHCGVMYDRTASGEFLHIYTGVIAGSFYVEVLQRIGDYDGFGSPNTPVRLVAQLAQRDDARRPAA